MFTLLFLLSIYGLSNVYAINTDSLINKVNEMADNQKAEGFNSLSKAFASTNLYKSPDLLVFRTLQKSGVGYQVRLGV